ncbi:MAG TPA: hypothetical protein VFE05_13695 [Longimicrobiaceae bacterium]|nr:hypothetical protein [Longimicrobiaceae bacterium]
MTLFRPNFRAAGPACAALLLLALLALPAAAQQTLRGHVVRESGGVGGVPVTLHRVTRTASGPVAKTVTSPDGSFAVAVPSVSADAGFTVFFATAEVDGVRYFGPPLHAGDARDGYRLQAYDTTSAPAAVDSVRIARRDVALIPEAQGGWEVGEIVRVDNRSHRTIVPGSSKPVWSLPVPHGITAFEVGEGEVVQGEVAHMGDRVYITAPITPGARELFIRYHVLAGRSSLPIQVASATDSLNVFIRQPAPKASVAGLSGPKPFAADSEKYVQFNGANLRPGARVVLSWDVPTPAPVDPKIAAIAVAGLLLLAGAGVAIRQSGRASSPPNDTGDAMRDDTPADGDSSDDAWKAPPAAVGGQAYDGSGSGAEPR